MLKINYSDTSDKGNHFVPFIEQVLSMLFNGTTGSDFGRHAVIQNRSCLSAINLFFTLTFINQRNWKLETVSQIFKSKDILIPFCWL